MTKKRGRGGLPLPSDGGEAESNEAERFATSARLVAIVIEITEALKIDVEVSVFLVGYPLRRDVWNSHFKLLIGQLAPNNSIWSGDTRFGLRGGFLQRSGRSWNIADCLKRTLNSIRLFSAFESLHSSNQIVPLRSCFAINIEILLSALRCLTFAFVIMLVSQVRMTRSGMKPLALNVVRGVKEVDLIGHKIRKQEGKENKIKRSLEHLSARVSLEACSLNLGARELATGWLRSLDGQAKTVSSIKEDIKALDFECRVSDKARLLAYGGGGKAQPATPSLD